MPSAAPRPFRIDVPETVLHDLRARLDAARLLDDSPRRPASGMTAAYLRELVSSWAAWDWRAREEWLNESPQFTATIDDAELHFVHRRASDPSAPALLVMHGWPHTFALQLDFARLLPDFHVVVPSLPGFGFSSPYRRGPLTEERMAATMHTLMTEVLGYGRYLTYGEDVSANVSDLLASRHPDHVAGIIATHAHFPTNEERAATRDAQERAFFARLEADQGAESGYAHLQGTRPDTLAAALNDSPTGLLAWLTEKLVEWSDVPAGSPPGAKPADPREVEQLLSRERILTEATIYWVTQSIGSSFRPYHESVETPMAPTAVPAAVFIQRHEADYPESLAHRFYRDLRVFARLERGGHFAAAEVPHDMADRVRGFATELGLLA
ncbi:epoxide hydrolase family protein [Microbacterium sp. Marseille-Q6965]|uniref:epoxide hydrolase family protein n=1 Tax=Microbacterium sp. Marseille-Q6965 TaxID=2965072 RepID=UPI0021B7ABC5|nr:epoxide hydrolase [Microbacterium sp. Marseille-Q6965]